MTQETIRQYYKNTHRALYDRIIKDPNNLTADFLCEHFEKLYGTVVVGDYLIKFLPPDLDILLKTIHKVINKIAFRNKLEAISQMEDPSTEIKKYLLEACSELCPAEYIHNHVVYYKIKDGGLSLEEMSNLTDSDFKQAYSYHELLEVLSKLPYVVDIQRNYVKYLLFNLIQYTKDDYTPDQILKDIDVEMLASLIN